MYLLNTLTCQLGIFQEAQHDRPRQHAARAFFLPKMAAFILTIRSALVTFHAELDGKPCPFAVDGRMPLVARLTADHPRYTVDKGRPGDFCPPCAKQQLGYLGHWQGYRGLAFPAELLGLRLFRCRLLFWLVVPGLYDHTPDRVEEGRGNGELPVCAL